MRATVNGAAVVYLHTSDGSFRRITEQRKQSHCASPATVSDAEHPLLGYTSTAKGVSDGKNREKTENKSILTSCCQDHRAYWMKYGSSPHWKGERANGRAGKQP